MHFKQLLLQLMLLQVHQFENFDLCPHPYFSLGHDLQNPISMRIN
jgi:hypothetical protein